MLNYIYDIETFPNVFTLSIKHHLTNMRWLFEISDRRNDYSLMISFLLNLQRIGAVMIGYNNVGFDYPVLHHILKIGNATTARHAYDKANAIIKAPKEERFGHMVWDNERYVDQLDLYKIHHFDNVSKATSLKMLEFNMQSRSIQELPFEPGTMLDYSQIDELIQYNHKDVDETQKFYLETVKQIEFRQYLSEKYNRNFMNHNDTKIGKDFFIMEMEKAVPGSCYLRLNGVRRMRQTLRPTIAINDVIFPYISFEQEGFNRILHWLRQQVITETKGVFKDLNTEVEGFKYVFGTGGMHGSIKTTHVVTTATHQIIDIDVTSYYPSLAIANRIYPEHLGDTFCDIYQDLKNQRMGHKKGTPENGMLKLALNGVYGDSGNQYGPFFDNQYMISITINGQLLLCMLAEQLIKIPGLQMIQINTDGMTASCPVEYIEHFRTVCKWWENLTKLDLEEAFYSSMWIRDVNNYIAQYPSGKLKRKGAYEYDINWHQNHSALIVKKATCAALVYGADPGEFIRNWPHAHDFMLATKVTGRSRLVLVDDAGKDAPGQKITRYYVSNKGVSLVKIMPPLKKNPEHWRRIGINVGHQVTECNDLDMVAPMDINFDYYINETRKLLLSC